MTSKHLKVVILVVLGLFSISANAQYDCDRGKYCKEMSSCDEAYYKLQVCGIERLDRDGDGVPCENVCGKGGKKAKKATTKKATSKKVKGKSKKKK